MVHSQSDLPEGEPSLLTTSVTVSDTTSPAHSPSKLQDPAFRILGKGDLVRIAERRGAGIKNRDGGLGRIIRSISIPQDELDAIQSHGPLDKHPFQYDVDFVLGGKICGVHRRDLIYTTADAEGMTADGDSMRAKRKRKTSSAVLASQCAPGSPKTKKGKPAAKGATKTGAAKKRSNGNGLPTSKRKSCASKGATSESSKKPKADESLVAAESNFIPKDVYERHYREFERMVTRLEKIDQFGFFWETEEGEEFNGGDQPIARVSDHLLNDTELGYSNSSLVPPGQIETQIGTSAAGEVIFPPPFLSSHPILDPFVKPPTFWGDIRKRREAGRYEMDRVTAIEEERRRRLAPYKTWKRMNKRVTESLKPKIPKGMHPRVLNPKGVHWDLYRKDIVAMCDAALAKAGDNGEGGSGTLGYAAKKIKDEMEKLYERTGTRHFAELRNADARHEFSLALQASDNKEAAFQGDWRRIPFPEREYDRLSSNLICSGLGPIDELSASYELRTTLPDGFLGISYKYNDTGQSEGWMKSVLCESSQEKERKGTTENRSNNEAKAAELLASDQGVVRAQVQATMQHLLIQVQDKVMTDQGILRGQELRVANWENSLPDPELVEQPVWGMDCYTRRNVMICLSVEFDSETALEYIEHWLLPAMNACPASLAHDMTNAAKILEEIPLQESDKDGNAYWSHSLLGRALTAKIRNFGPPWLTSVSYQLRRAISTLGYDFFRVHPKGHGSIVLSPKLKANTLVTYYRGEVYPSWRWGEKMDAIEMTQERLGLRPNLPDFYNMALERPQADPRGYGLMIIDASRKSGHGSMLSHSCEPTCEVRVASVNGVLSLAMTTLRDIEQGEELTFDYNAVTESLTEYSSAVCLCGFRKCRGSFLHFATADCYQRVLNRNSPIAVRFANLVKGCMKKVMGTEDEIILTNHGFGSAAFGAVSFNRYKLLGGMPSTARLHSLQYVPVWLRTYVADILRYIEYERRALPVALLCDHLENFKVKPPESLGKSKPRVPSKVPDNVKPKVRDKPENAYIFYCRQKREEFTALLREKGVLENFKGLESDLAVKRAMGTSWKALSEDMKSMWKQKALDDWTTNATVNQQSGEVRVKKLGGGPNDTDVIERPSIVKKSDDSLENDEKHTMNSMNSLTSAKISFEAADAEGVSAMEQRIQQLTQALSRIGRVLDRHRQAALGSSVPSVETINQVHAPLSIMSDRKAISWMWTDSGGPVQSLLHFVENEKCASPGLKESLKRVVMKNKSLSDFSLGCVELNSCDLSPSEARNQLVQALCEMRDCLLSSLNEMDKDMKRCKRDFVRKRKAEREFSEVPEARSIVAMVLQDLVNQIAGDKLKPVSLLHSAPGSVQPHRLPTKEHEQLQLAVDQGLCAHTRTLLPIYRELARLMEEIRRRDGEKQRFVFDKEYIKMHASPTLVAYIAEKSISPTFHKNITRALVPLKFKDLFEALRCMIRKRFKSDMPVDDLMDELCLIDFPVTKRESPKAVPPTKQVYKEAEVIIPTFTQTSNNEMEEPYKSGFFSIEKVPWLEYFDDRWKLEAAADLLVLYARTTTFFELIPYTPLKSTPIEVYARELGNAVPKSKIEVAHASSVGDAEGVVLVASNNVQIAKNQINISPGSKEEDRLPSNPGTESTTIDDLCKPDDVITNVTVLYDGSFVLSQLLQWYNGGIGQKSGLPDMLGCVVLPSMSGCFNGTLKKKGSKANPKTTYASELRQLLVKWLEDPRQRGGPLPDDLRQVFAGSNERISSESNLVFMGSPVLDLLIMGDDTNLNLALNVLRDHAATEMDSSSHKPESATDHLQSTVDEGRPAQAVANWVQCENPKCLKWRKVPWHVDLDMLPEKFFCIDNVWNISSNSCDAPEEEWDENDTQLRNDGIEKSIDHASNAVPVLPKSNTKATKTIMTKRQAAKVRAEARGSSTLLKQGITASATTRCEGLPLTSEKELHCNYKELSKEQIDKISTSVPHAFLPKANNKAQKKINTKIHVSYMRAEEGDTSTLLEPSPTLSSPTQYEELSAISEKELPCNDEGLIDGVGETTSAVEPHVLSRLPRKKMRPEQDSNSGLLSSFVKPFATLDSIQRELNGRIPQKHGCQAAVPRKKSSPCKQESPMKINGSRELPADVTRKKSSPQTEKGSVLATEAKNNEPSSIQEPLITPAKQSRWGPRLTFREEVPVDLNGTSRSDFFDYESEQEWFEDKPHPLLGSRFLQRKW